MKYVVAKPFNSHTQRFAVGAPVLDTDDLTPFDREGLRDRGFIAPEVAAVAEPAPEPVETLPQAVPEPPPRTKRPA